MSKKKSSSAKLSDNIDEALLVQARGKWKYDDKLSPAENDEALVAAIPQFSGAAPELHRASWLRSVSTKLNPPVQNPFDDYVSAVTQEPKADIIFKTVSKPSQTQDSLLAEKYAKIADDEVARINALLNRSGE